MLIIGCHLSSSKGFLAMGKTAVDIGANTFQFFTRNPRGGTAKPLDLEDVAAYRDFAKEHSLFPILAHAPYTLNCCAADPGLRDFARRSGEPLHPYTRRELYEIVLPVEGSRLLASGLQAVESSLIPYTLALYTGSRAVAMTQYGNLKGMALPLLFFPFSVLAALSGLLMPEIARACTRKDGAAARRLIGTMLRLTGGFSVLAGVFFAVLGPQLAQLVYRDAEVGAYVQILGCIAPFMYLESMVDGVLKGLGEQLATFRYSLADSVLRIAAICLLLPRYGMPGFLAVMIASNLFTFTLNTRRMLKVAAAI